MPAAINAMTIDVEDYFQVSAFEHHISRDNWDSLECRVERNIETMLEMLDSSDSKATFFVLGWIAERYPDIVRKIVAQGHELASHGYGHQRVRDLTPELFREDLQRAKGILEDLGRTEVKGYRAPSYSIGRENLWALEVLAETGHQYSSSIYPIKHDHYGIPDAPRFIFRDLQSGLIEIPITTIEWGAKRLPAGGGGFFRLYPYRLSKWLIDRINRKDAQACLFYIHPWELDPGQPRQEGVGLKTRFRHYLNLNKTARRWQRLLNDYQWDRMDNVFLSQTIPEFRLQ